MKVLVVGSGGREHALAWMLRRSRELEHLYVAPGNGGTETIATNVAITADDVDGLLQFAEKENIDLTVVGPEAPLVAGIGDRFADAGRRCFGPSSDAARLEGSKVFAKDFMRRHRIPTARFETFDDADAARRHVDEVDYRVVVKAEGLAAGKGVIVAADREQARAAIDEIMVRRAFGESGARVVIEERLEGREVSVHSICAGGDAVMFPMSQDHKRALDGDRGPNTGGMGAYAPVPFVSEGERRAIYETIVLATLRGMASDGNDFNGVLYVGLMMTADGPKVLEYNVRFGDPETQVLVPLVKGDAIAVLRDAADGTLSSELEFFEDRAVATVVVASQGYPGAYEKGRTIRGVESVDADDRVVYHAGTQRDGDRLVTSGGRVLAVSAWAPDLGAALARAYEGVEKIDFDGAFWRTDIGRQAQEQ